MGINNEPIEFTQELSVPSFTTDNLAQLEAALQTELPGAYKQFVLAHSQQTLDTACFVSREENGLYPAGANEIAFFVSRFLGSEEVLKTREALLTWAEKLLQPGDLPNLAFLPIAELETDVKMGPGHLVLLGIAETNVGQLYFLDAELGQDQHLP